MNRSNLILARRYARALFLSSQEKDMLDTVEKDLRLVVETIGENPELQSMIGFHAILQGAKKDIFEKLFADKITGLTMNFIKLVIDKHREQHLEDILAEFGNIIDEARGIVEVDIRSAFQLPPEQEEMVRQRLSEELNKDVRLNIEVDPDLLGGIIMKIGDKLFDASAKYQLRALERSLKTAHFEEDRGEQVI
ncbi:MAG: ATP synthase F1 subunit delta [Clostridia bacterium]|nr:ATP synthase F1 subunit delta [Clostridia bacterium]